jgi:DNA-binding SARP family transcriptional activator
MVIELIMASHSAQRRVVRRESRMSTTSVHLFGNLHVQRGSSVVDGIDGRKVQELFCYLLLHRQSPRSREALAGLLWAENTSAQAKKYLRQALWQLQSALDDRASAKGDPPLLLVTSDSIQINPQADLWLDVAEFEQAWRVVLDVRGEELDSAQAQQLRAAVELYHGDFLEDSYEDWCLYERDRLRSLLLAMLDKLMIYCEAQREYERGLVYGARILRYDRARERTHRRVMRLYNLMGDRTAALRQYECCTMALQEELCVEPDARTQALYDQIRLDHRDSVASHAPTRRADALRAVPEPTAIILARVLAELKRLQAAHSGLQQQVEQSILAIEQSLAASPMLGERAPESHAASEVLVGSNPSQFQAAE